jgi:DNA polymerase-3 subunit chi
MTDTGNKKIFAEFFECPSSHWKRELCKRVAEQYAAGTRVYVWAESQAEALELDELLWTFDEGSFIPHCLWSSEGGGICADAVAVGWLPQSPNDATVLVVAGAHTGEELLEFGGSFGRILDFVPTLDQRAKTAARARYKALNGGGFSMRFHPSG